MNNDTESRPIPEVLRDAAHVLQERGHCKGGFEDEDGSVCAMGAINVALGVWHYSPDSIYAANVYRTPVVELLVQRGDMRTIVQWNDAPETTCVDVEKLFLQAADDAEFGDLS